MSFVSILIIAVGLAMDSFAVSIAGGVSLPEFKLRDSIRVGFVMGLAQALFFAFGYFTAFSIAPLIKSWDHWLAFVLLFSIGLKMILEHKKENDEKLVDLRRKRILCTLAVATSIDALAVGISFSFLDYEIVTTLFVVGFTSLVFAAVGVYLGAFFCGARKFPTYWIGGLLLIGLGTKILIEHLVKHI